MSAIRFSANKKFHLLQTKTSNWETRPAELEHYRLIFITSGQGQFVLDSDIYHYQKSGLVFLNPGQQPVFQLDKNTEVLVLAFDTYLSDDFQQKKAFDPDFADTYKQAEKIFKNSKFQQGKMLSNERDGQTIAYLFNQIAFEITEKPSSHIKLIRGSIELIVNILGRNNFEAKKAETKTSQQNLTEQMIDYLRNELQQNNTIRIPAMLLKFNISEEAANLCMMNRTGMSLRNFIFKFKADLFKSRALKVDIAEISPYLQRV